jgi:membrane protein
MKLKESWGMLKETASEWWSHNAQRLGAALAFYTMLSTAPLLVIATYIAGMAFGKQAAQGELVRQMRDLLGPQGAEAVQTMLANAYHPTTGIWATIVSVVVLLVGATGVFAELQDALNTIWGVPPRPGGGVWAVVKSRFLTFAMVLAVGFLLLVLLVVSAAVTALSDWFDDLGSPLLWHGVSLLVSLGIATLLFALIYKILPDVDLGWLDVLVGAALTAVLFSLGKFLIGLYLGSSGMGTAYGAAGSLAVFLIWIYYSAQIFYFGAEFTKVYACRCRGRSTAGARVALPCGPHTPAQDREPARSAATAEGHG